MCGILGYKTNSSVRQFKEDIIRGQKSLSHRGPDDSGLLFNNQDGIGLAHRRLSIIDLSNNGRQPMSSDDGSVVITYNGEVYNFIEIRKTLSGLGHHFHSSTDTEVILKAYLQWGTDCFQKFIGMFSLALWDSRSKSLILARDRLGIKPLYYYFNEGNFIFASELKALMAFHEFPRDVDSNAIALFLHYQYIPGPDTVFKNTFKLMPGTYLIHSKNSVTIHHYWQFPKIFAERTVSCSNKAESLEKLDTLLTRAVSDRMISDVPIGALLSGGIDSSVVVALMQKVSSSPVKTFSIGFNEKRYNEAAWASRIASHLGTDHTELYVSADDALNVIPRLPDIYDEPFADSSAVSTFLVCQLSHSHVKVALSGDGGDEQFCGYVRYWATASAANGLTHIPYGFRKLLKNFFMHLPSECMEKLYISCHDILPKKIRIANFPDKWQKLIRLLDQNQLSELYRMTVCLWSKDELRTLVNNNTLKETLFDKIFIETRGTSLLSRLLRVDQMTYLPDAMLTKVDRASMAVGLEVRVPLLDHRIIEFSSSLPDNLKFYNGDGKYLLKQLLLRYVPRQLFERPKMGFGVPVQQWLKTDLKALLLDYLSPERLRKEGTFNENLIKKTVKEHLSGRANHHHQLWALLMWEMWRERWLGA